MIAPTGSGKTECAVVPIFELLRAHRPGVRAIYVTPLRALNRDVMRRITGYARTWGLEVGVRHGDTPQRERRRISESPPDVLVTTPEALVALLVQPRMLAAFSNLEWVVIDEVHELLSSKRGSQLSLTLERLAENADLPLTRIGLSATVGNWREASKFVSGSRRRCLVARDPSVRGYDVAVEYVEGTAADAADAIAGRVSELSPGSPVLLFANTRGEAELMASLLRERSDLPVDMHHGSLSRESREEAEDSLRAGSAGVVVCTSSLELGLDIGDVDLVIHYGSPRQASKLVQRIGRSRHAGGAPARGLIITNSADDELEALAILGRVRGGSIEPQALHERPLDVLAHHMVGLSMQLGGVEVERALNIARRAYPFRDLGLDELAGVLELLDDARLVSFERGAMSFRRGPRSIRYHFENLTTIPDMLRFRVFDSVGKRIVGTLDQRFVGDHGEQGNIFVLRGSQWRVMAVDEKALRVSVEPVRTGGASVPYWEGESIPVDFGTASEVGRLRRTAGDNIPDRAVRDLGFPVPCDDMIVAESNRAAGAVVIHACLGTRINSTIGTVLSSVISAATGSSVEARSDAYRIALSSRSRITEERLADALAGGYDLRPAAEASVSGTHNANWRTWCAAKRFGMVSKDAVYDRRHARLLHERYSGLAISNEALRELFHDKYDLEGAARIIGMIRDGRIRMKWAEVPKFSKLAAPVLDHATRYYAAPASLEKGVLDLVRARLERTRHRLVCARCGRWERLIETRDAVRLSCPKCRSRQVSPTFHSDLDLSGIIRKKRAGLPTEPDEDRRAARAWKAASLVAEFGRDAILALSGYGVGPDTAARILRDMPDADRLLRQIYEAERQYVVTRGFWD